MSVLLVGLYSSRYAAIGESHGLSVIGGVLEAATELVREVRILDMAAYGDERPHRIVDEIRASVPDVVGVAVPYGAFSVLSAGLPAIRAAVDPLGSRVVYGGALATYLADDLLGLDPSAVVVVGEGEAPILALLAQWSRGIDDLRSVPGVAFVIDGEVVKTARSLADLGEIPPPVRHHVPEIARSGGQVYVESSRACSWAGCTFCLRGLTDIDGKPREYRRFPAGRLAIDLRRLHDLGIPSVVFADEDFLGADLVSVESYLDELERCVSPEEAPTFEFSTTIHSVYRHDDDRTGNLVRARLLARLRRLGLRKVFLGIESGSNSQLRRYAKGHRADECAAAIYRVREAGLRLEVGFIMFDPLCSIDEVGENVAFIRRTGITSDISSVTNELRLQQGSRYLHLLDRHEREQGHVLYDREVDKDTLSHSYRYASEDVDRLVGGIRPATKALQSISYPVKNLSRHGEGSTAGDLRDVLARWKETTLTAIQSGVEAAVDGLDPGPPAAAGMIEAGWVLAADVVGAHRRLAPEIRDHPVLLRAVERCRAFLDDPEALVRAHSTVDP